jgi:flagellar biosynthesis protein FlhB
MSDGSDDDSDKEHAPSQKRLDDARQRGEIARSADLLSAAALGGFVIAAISVGPSAFQRAGAAGMVLLDRSEDLAVAHFETGQAMIGSVLFAMLTPLWPFFIVPAASVTLVIFATRGFVISGDKLAPKLSRISPLVTAKQKFGLDGLFEFGKGTLKLVLISFLLFLFFKHHLNDVLSSLSLSAGIVSQLLLNLLKSFMILALSIAVILGGLDFGWQFYRHHQRHRMSRKEMMDEMKDSEGDPHVKGQRRQRAHEIATNRMLLEVPKADVVIVNPTHYAVALQWKRGSKAAPICVAKGIDEIAAQIRARAAESGVPIHSDPPTARAIHATVDLGKPIKPEHFKAVAAAIRFSEAMRSKARKSWRS